MGFTTTRCSLSGAPLPVGTPVVSLLLAFVNRWVPFGLPARGTLDGHGRFVAHQVDRATRQVLRGLEGWSLDQEWAPLASRSHAFQGVALGQAVVDAGVFAALVASARVPAPHGRSTLRNTAVDALVALAFEPPGSHPLHADGAQEQQDDRVEALVDLVHLRALGAAWTPQHDLPGADASTEAVAQGLVKAKAAMAPWPRAVKELDALVRAWAGDEEREAGDDEAPAPDGAVAARHVGLRQRPGGGDDLELDCAPARLAPVLALVRAGAPVRLTSPAGDLTLKAGPTCQLEVPTGGGRTLTLDVDSLAALSAANALRRPQTVALSGGWRVDLS